MYPERDSSFSVGEKTAPIRVVIFHGYTGSTDEFESLADRLHQTLDAFVSVPLLPGHGTNEADLFGITYEDFRTFALRHTEHVASGAERLIFIGHSFGGYLAAECAAKYSANALVLTVVPFWLRFPLNIPGLAWLMRQRQLWDKKLPLQERIERIGLFYYQYMPGIALTLLNHGIRNMHRVVRMISCPILTVYTAEDPLTYQASGRAIIRQSGGNSHSQAIIVERQDHGLFYGADHERVIENIVDFVREAVEKNTPGH